MGHPGGAYTSRARDLVGAAAGRLAVRLGSTRRSDLPTDGSEAIVSVWDRQTKVLTEKITAWSGNPCEVTEMDAAELRAAVERDDRLIRDLREYAVALAGSDPRALLRREVMG